MHNSFQIFPCSANKDTRANNHHEKTKDLGLRYISIFPLEAVSLPSPHINHTFDAKSLNRFFLSWSREKKKRNDSESSKDQMIWNECTKITMSTTMVLSTYLYFHFLWSIKKEQENVNQLHGSPDAIYGAHKKVVSRDEG